MRRGIKRYLCVFMAAAVMLGGIQIPAEVKAQESRQGEERTAAAVTTCDEFKKALAEKKSPITVKGNITIVNGAESSGRMLPIKIPQGTVIQGDGSGGLSSRCPIQLEGDGVCFKNIKLHFESTDALWSVPHREIYLAGHSLILDNVDTYLEGGAEIGGIGGFETELLPTVYAGGYPGAALGSNASLTVMNSNDKTMFKAIYMGHGTENGTHALYQGNAELNLDAKAVVREGVDASKTSQAMININGTDNQTARVTKFYGNANTTLTVNKVSVEKATVDGLGSIVLKDKACLTSMTEKLQNITVQNGACLDLNNLKNVVISGNFSGEENSSNEKGILVLHPEGTLEIKGNVTGTTQFQTRNRLFPGTFLTGKIYITANGSQQNFVLPQKKTEEGYGLNYENGKWSVTGNDPSGNAIGWMEILYAPTEVDLRKIPIEKDDIEKIPDPNIYMEIKWYKDNGTVFTPEEVLDDANLFYSWFVTVVRTDYWESDSEDVLSSTDWSNTITLVPAGNNSDRYCLQAQPGERVGNYTFLFWDELPEFGENSTVADIKKFEDKVIGECSVSFYNEDTEGSDSSEHKHAYSSSVTKKATCTETGIRTFTCNCGDRYTEEIPLAPHRYTQKRTPATMNSSGMVQQICSVCSNTRTAAIIDCPRIAWGKTDFSYDGKVKALSVTVQDTKGKVLKAGTDYQISYSEGRKNPGIYTATVVFSGNYSGKAAKSFTVKPKKTSLKKASAKSKGMQVSWKKQTAQMDGYQLQYSTNASFKGKTTKLATAKKSAVSKKISKLKGKKKYYVRIRTYKTVKADGKTVKLYSEWSAKKSVKTKK